MSKADLLQKLWKEFKETDDSESSELIDCFHWATKNGRWSPRPMDVSKIFLREMSDALRQETRIDVSGREYRANLNYRENVGGVQLSLWSDIDTCTDKFAGKAVKQRRQGIISDCYKLKQDVDHLNEYRFQNTPILLVLDFTEDVEELEAAKREEDKDEDEDAA